jgi:type IV pilus assembly protein PilB
MKKDVGPGFGAGSFQRQAFRIPEISLETYEIAASVTRLVPRELCLRHRVIPVSCTSSGLVVAMVDPTDAGALAALALHTGLPIAPAAATEADVASAINKYYRQ